METMWYYAVDGVRHGPVPFAELREAAKSGALRPLDLVWQPEFGPEWRNAGQVRELFETDSPPDAPFSLRAAAPEVQLVGVVGERPSCLAALSQAYDRVVDLLFRPFDPVRWFSIGFCAWLAYLASQGSFNADYGMKDFSGAQFKRDFDAALDKLNAASVGTAEVGAVIAGVVIFALFMILFCKLRSRGDFMFLHRWYRPDEPIRTCWAASRAAGQALFVWRMWFFAVMALLFALDGVLLYGLVLKPYLAAGKVWGAALVRPAVCCVTAAVLLAVLSELVAHLAKAVVVPVMYWQGVSASRAWLAVFSLCNQYPFAVVCYLLCGMACSVAAGTAIVIVGLLTCCIGFIPLILPYVGTVVLLPYFLFFRGYAVCFLSQWRRELVPGSV